MQPIFIETPPKMSENLPSRRSVDYKENRYDLDYENQKKKKLRDRRDVTERVGEHNLCAGLFGKVLFEMGTFLLGAYISKLIVG